jgi:hypothetical protein
MPTAGPPRRDRQPEAQQLPAKTSFRSLDRLRDGRAVDDLEPGPQPGCCTAWASSAIAWRIWVVAGDRILPLLISSSTLRAQLSDQDLTQREHGRAAARRGLPDPAATAPGDRVGDLRGRGRAAVGQPTGAGLPSQPLAAGRPSEEPAAGKATVVPARLNRAIICVHHSVLASWRSTTF